tara:strand:+ start:3277 stop:3585 length:309 start_codon:yes stop_codon:yes gene_type:complete
LYKIGSKKEVIKAPNDKIESVIETFDTLIDLKKKTQCNDMITPQNNNLKIIILEIFIFFPKKGANNNKHIDAINILYQTNFIESIEIIEPNIAVNPKIKTIK